MPNIRFTFSPKIPSDMVDVWGKYVQGSVHEVTNVEADRWLRRGVAEVISRARNVVEPEVKLEEVKLEEVKPEPVKEEIVKEEEITNKEETETKDDEEKVEDIANVVAPIVNIRPAPGTRR